MCENSFDGIVHSGGKGIKSRKDGGGIGLCSVKDIVEKYNGCLKIENEANIFRLYAYLQKVGETR